MPHRERRFHSSGRPRDIRLVIHSRSRELVKNKKLTDPNNKITNIPTACQGSRIIRRMTDIKVAETKREEEAPSTP